MPSNKVSLSLSSFLLPLVLAQFVASYAASNMNVAISAIATDLNTNITGIQTTITLFTLTMAALMIPGSKLTDIIGRKRCFVIGLIVYGAGALLAAISKGLGPLMIGYSFMEGIGSALLIPPVYIIITVLYSDLKPRAKAFGLVSAAAGIGAAAGPLIGGVITSAISWRASFILQVLIVLAVIVLSRNIKKEEQLGDGSFDVVGGILSALSLFFIVLGILQSGTYGWFTSSKDFYLGNILVIPIGGISPVWLFVFIGVVIMAIFLFYIYRREKQGKVPLFSISLFKNKESNLGLITQNMQWLTLQGGFFVVSVFIQTIQGRNAIQTGLILTPATIGILASSILSGRLARKFAQKSLIVAGFIGEIIGFVTLLILVNPSSGFIAYVPGFLLVGLSIGVMLTSSVNVVQSSFPEEEQGEISGVSRSVSNLGSSMGTAIVGSILVVSLITPAKTFALAMVAVIIFAAIGLMAGLFLPKVKPT